jgi:hypothetical protein
MQRVAGWAGIQGKCRSTYQRCTSRLS